MPIDSPQIDWTSCILQTAGKLLALLCTVVHLNQVLSCGVAKGPDFPDLDKNRLLWMRDDRHTSLKEDVWARLASQVFLVRWVVRPLKICPKAGFIIRSQ